MTPASALLGAGAAAGDCDAAGVSPHAAAARGRRASSSCCSCAKLAQHAPTRRRGAHAAEAVIITKRRLIAAVATSRGCAGRARGVRRLAPQSGTVSCRCARAAARAGGGRHSVSARARVQARAVEHEARRPRACDSPRAHRERVTKRQTNSGNHLAARRACGRRTTCAGVAAQAQQRPRQRVRHARSSQRDARARRCCAQHSSTAPSAQPRRSSRRARRSTGVPRARGARGA